MHWNSFSCFKHFVPALFFLLATGLKPVLAQQTKGMGTNQGMPCDSLIEKIERENYALRTEINTLKQRISYLESLNTSPANPPRTIQPLTAKPSGPINAPTPNPRQNKIRPRPILQLKKEMANALVKFPPTLAKQFNVFGKNYDAFVVDLHKNSSVKIKFFWKDRQNKKYYRFDKVQNEHTENFIFATNGGMFTSQFDPQGLLVEEGVVKQSLNARKNGMGNFYMQPNGIFSIDTQGNPHILRTDRYHLRKTNTRYATQSGPMLIHDGQINRHFTRGSKNLRLRSGIGLIDQHRIVFIISKEPVNFYDFALVFKEILNCRDALFLDGVISKFYCPELKLNDPLIGNYATIIGVYKE